jgi:hypothetical protein
MQRTPPQRLPHPVFELTLGEGVGSSGAMGKCSACGVTAPVESVTVRVYSKRSQVDFRYRVCKEDKKVLYELLATGANEIQRGIFNPPQEWGLLRT